MDLGLYIGCGTDVEILSKLPEIGRCIFIDSMPLTEYGDLYHNKHTGITDISKTYMVQFQESARKAGFIKINLDGTYPHVYRNYNSLQEIYHYFNLSFPIYSIKTNYAGNKDEITKLIQQLKSVKYLIVVGYSPNYSIFKYFSNQVCFIGDYSTIYKDNLDNLLSYEYDKVTNILQKNQINLRNKISSYIYFDKNGNKCLFSSYDAFINKTIE
jgi:hypothetical protein